MSDSECALKIMYLESFDFHVSEFGFCCLSSSEPCKVFEWGSGLITVKEVMAAARKMVGLGQRGPSAALPVGHTL